MENVMRFPSINDVAAELREINKQKLEPDDADEGIDVRLQVYPDGQWAVRYGSSDYDQDHRGFWGSASVPGNNRRFDSKDVARDLIDQAREQKATGGDEGLEEHVKEAKEVEDDEDGIPIANPEDCDYGERHSRMRLYEFQFGPYTGTEVYVWADDDESAFEIAVEWLDDNAPGYLVKLTEDDLKEAAEDLGIEWDEVWSDVAAGKKEFGATWSPWDDKEYQQIVEHAEADLTAIGHTTLKHGEYIRSDDWHFHEVTDEKEIEEVADASQEEEDEG